MDHSGRGIGNVLIMIAAPLAAGIFWRLGRPLGLIAALLAAVFGAAATVYLLRSFFRAHFD